MSWNSADFQIVLGLSHRQWDQNFFFAPTEDRERMIEKRKVIFIIPVDSLSRGNSDLAILDFSLNFRCRNRASGDDVNFHLAIVSRREGKK